GTAAVVFYTNIRENSSATRAVDATNEETVHTADVLLFQEGKYVRTVRGTHLATAAFLVMLEEGETFDVEVLVNARDLIPDDIETGTPKADVLAALLTKSDNYLPNTASGIPAWGEVEDLTVEDGTSCEVDLLRMMARVDIVLSETAASKFTITDVYLYKYNTVGSVVPSTLATEVTTPTVPSSSSLAATALHYTATSIYLYESENKTSTGIKEYDERTCLVVGGTYQGAKTYYRMDFVKKGTTDAWYDVLRNHKYTFTVTDVTGAGDDTPDDAWKDAPVNVTFDVLEWNDTSYGDIVFDGVHHLGVSPSSFNFYSNAHTGTLNVTTDVSSWSIKAENADGSPCTWITGISPASGTATAGTQVSFNVGASTVMRRTAYLVITAGQLEYKVLVAQGIIQWAYSNIILKDGKLTFATTAAENAEIPANSEGLQFRWGSLIGVNIQVPTKTYGPDRIAFIPSEYTVSINDLTAIPNASSASQLSGYDAAAGTGDICRYISDKGWVEGDWRMPTLAEAQQTIAAGYVKYGAVFKPDPGNFSPTNDLGGTLLMDSGLFFGTADADPSYLTGDMPLGGVFLPAGYTIESFSLYNYNTDIYYYWVSGMNDNDTFTYMAFADPDGYMISLPFVGNAAAIADNRKSGSVFYVRCVRVSD
ncbi:MAG: DUF4906 domain-containing protein, partial [Prevotellaceae bacterium]|nr:DUF4906 domain-containing protein [Prevotellaceae bacterium]